MDEFVEPLRPKLDGDVANGEGAPGIARSDRLRLIAKALLMYSDW